MRNLDRNIFAHKRFRRSVDIFHAPRSFWVKASTKACCLHTHNKHCCWLRWRIMIVAIGILWLCRMCIIFIGTRSILSYTWQCHHYRFPILAKNSCLASRHPKTNTHCPYPVRFVHNGLYFCTYIRFCEALCSILRTSKHLWPKEFFHASGDCPNSPVAFYLLNSLRRMIQSFGVPTGSIYYHHGFWSD